jgi:hypothetical protein
MTMVRINFFTKMWKWALFFLVVSKFVAQMLIIYGHNLRAWNWKMLVLGYLLLSCDVLLQPTIPWSGGDGTSSGRFKMLVAAGSEVWDKSFGALDASSNGHNVRGTVGLFLPFIVFAATGCLMTSSSTQDAIGTVLALAGWVTVLILPSPDNTGTLDASRDITMFESVFISKGASVSENLFNLATLRAMYYAFLASVMPWLCVEIPDVICSLTQVRLHHVLCVSTTAVWIYLFIYMQNRAQIVRDLRNRGLWKAASPPTGGRRVAAWKSGVRYNLGHVVCVTHRGGGGGAGDKSPANTSKTSGTTYWELTSDTACSSVKPSELGSGSDGPPSRHEGHYKWIGEDVAKLSDSNICLACVMVMTGLCIAQVLTAGFFVRSAPVMFMAALDIFVLLVTKELIFSNFESAGLLEPAIALFAKKHST